MRAAPPGSRTLSPEEALLPQPAPAAPSAAPAAAPFGHRAFFESLRELGALRVISRSGASTFEAICRFGPFGFAQGHMNAITDAYHWHLELAGFGHLRSRDEVHARSGRRVLFFELRRDAASDPFLWIYLYRGPEEEIGAEREARFAALHALLAHGVTLACDGSPR